MNYTGVLNDLKSYYVTRCTIDVLNKTIGINGANLLVLLHIKEGHNTLTKLDDTLSIDRALIHKSIKGLEKSGIISRNKEKRSKNISITSKGEDILKEAIKLYEC